jgi:hypothetical protein
VEGREGEDREEFDNGQVVVRKGGVVERAARSFNGLVVVEEGSRGRGV